MKDNKQKRKEETYTSDVKKLIIEDKEDIKKDRTAKIICSELVEQLSIYLRNTRTYQI